MPEVRGRWAHDSGARVLRLDLEQRQPGPPFRLPVEVGVGVPGEAGPRLERIELTDRRQSFSIPLEREPQSVVLDPRSFVLMDAKIGRADGAK